MSSHLPPSWSSSLVPSRGWPEHSSTPESDRSSVPLYQILNTWKQKSLKFYFWLKKNVKYKKIRKNSVYFLLWRNRNVGSGTSPVRRNNQTKKIERYWQILRNIPYANATQKSVLRIQNHPLRIHAFCFNLDPNRPFSFPDSDPDFEEKKNWQKFTFGKKCKF